MVNLANTQLFKGFQHVSTILLLVQETGNHPLRKSGQGKWIVTGFLEATRSSEANYRSIIYKNHRRYTSWSKFNDNYQLSNLFEGYDMIMIKIRSGANILLWFKVAKDNHPQNVDYLPIIIYYLSISTEFFHMFHGLFFNLKQMSFPWRHFPTVSPQSGAPQLCSSTRREAVTGVNYTILN